MRRSSRHWTQHDIARLRQLSVSHVRVSVIARELGRSTGAVRTRARLEGISLSASGRALLSRWWPAVEQFRAGRDGAEASPLGESRSPFPRIGAPL